MTITPQDLVNREVHYCASSLVYTLANTDFSRARTGDPMTDLIEQAMDLAAPIDDWAEAASEHGLTLEARADGLHVLSLPKPDADGTLSDMHGTAYKNSEQASIAYCDFHGLEPYQHEVFEHWIVSDWLADKLEAEGEKTDRDFAGMTIWARTTTGQAIYADGVIERICAALNVA